MTYETLRGVLVESTMVGIGRQHVLAPLSSKEKDFRSLSRHALTT